MLSMLRQLTTAFGPSEYIKEWREGTRPVSVLVDYVQSNPLHYSSQFVTVFEDEESDFVYPQQLMVITVWDYYYMSLLCMPNDMSVRVGTIVYQLQTLVDMS